MNFLKFAIVSSLFFLSGPFTLASEPLKEDPSGVYTSLESGDGTTLEVVSADNGTFANLDCRFRNGRGNGAGIEVECVDALSGGPWLASHAKVSSPNLKAELSLKKDDLVLRVENQPKCDTFDWKQACGYPDEGDGIALSRKEMRTLRQCVVKAKKSFFFDPLNGKRTKSYVLKGDLVQAGTREFYPGAAEQLKQGRDQYVVLARFNGKKKLTAGLLKRSDLRCQ